MSNLADKKNVEMVHEADWEHRNPFSEHLFYWAKRVELGVRDASQHEASATA